MAKRTDYDSPWKDLVEKYFQSFRCQTGKASRLS